MSAASVLLIRVNSAVELFQTKRAVDQVRVRFPGARVVTLATPQTETLSALRSDKRIDEVLLFPPEGSDPTAKSPAAFRRFVASRRFSAVVVCYGSTHGLDYNRHILSALVCPGQRFFLDAQGQIFPLLSARGLALIRNAAAGQVGQRLAYAVLRKITSRLLRPRPGQSTSLQEAFDGGQIRRALCIRLDHIGDLVLCLPAMQALKRRAPHLVVDALVYPTSAQVLAGQTTVNETLTYDAPHFSRQRRKSGLKELWATVCQLRHRHYDLIIDLHGDDTARLLAFLSGARYRLGPERIDSEPPNKPNLSFLLTHTPQNFEQLPDEPRHAIECGLLILEPLGLGGERGGPLPQSYMMVSEEARQEVALTLEKLGVPRRFAVLHASSSVPIKDWRPERFAAVADQLVEKYGLGVVLTGSPQDQESNGVIRSQAQHRACMYDVSAHVPLRHLAALFERTEVLVTVDTGTMHVAAAVGTPLVALFLPWYTARFRPSNQRHEILVPTEDSARNEEAVPGEPGSLLDSIHVEQVMAAVDRLRPWRHQDTHDA